MNSLLVVDCYVDGDNTVTLIVNDIESPEEIDLRRAEEAKARAEERLRSKNPRSRFTAC